MTHFGGRLPYMAPRPKPRDILGTMVAHGPKLENQGRIEALAERWVKPEPPTKTAPRGRRSNRRRGTAAEGLMGGKGAAAVLRREGYTVGHSRNSEGSGDVWAFRQPGVDGPGARAIQAKRHASFEASQLNDAVKRFEGIGRHPYPFLVDRTVTRCEAWLMVGETWVARVWIGDDGLAHVIDGELAVEVVTSINLSLARERDGRNRPKQRTGPTFRERLGA